MITNATLFLNSTMHTGTIQFNICEKVAKPTACNDLEDKDSTGYFITSDDQCFVLTSSKDTNWKISSLEGGKTPDGIKFFANNDNLRTAHHWDVSYKLVCKQEAKEPTVTASSELSLLTITMESQTACGKDLLGPFPELLKNPYIIYPIVFSVGLALAGVGIIIYKYLFALIAFISGYDHSS